MILVVLFHSQPVIVQIRPPLSKKLFPVSRVGRKKASREVGNLFFSPNFIFYKLECTGGGGEVKKQFWTGNYFLFEDGLPSGHLACASTYLTVVVLEGALGL